MKKSLFDVFAYADYRQLLRDALKYKTYTYRSFSEQNGAIISFSMLGAALSAGRGGTKNKPTRTLSNESLVRIGKALKFTDAELAHLIFLKLENDAETYPGPYGGSFQDLAKTFVNESRAQAKTTGAKLKDEQYTRSSIALLVADAVDALPEAAKLKVAREILPILRSVLARQRRKPGVKILSQKITKLEELTRT